MKYLLSQLVLVIFGRVMGIINDYGTSNLLLATSGLECSNKPGSDVFTKIVNFHGSFARIPQVIIFLNQYYLHNLKTEFVLSIPEIKNENFTIQVQCLQAYPVYTLILQWVAVDDDRITVINKFYINDTTISTQYYTFNHTNQFAKKGFVLMTNFGLFDPFYFYLQISSITSSQVTVKLQFGSSKPLSVGFQVVIGTADAFDVSSLITFAKLASQSMTVPKPAGQKLFLALSRIYWAYSTRNLTLQIIWQDTDYNTNYVLKTTAGEYYEQFSYQGVWLNLQNSKVSVPFLCKNWRVSKKQDYTALKTQVFIKQTNQYFTIGYSGSIILDDTQTTINLITTFRCSSVSKVSGTVLLCIDCQNQTKGISNNCHGGINLMEHHFIFIQKNQVYQQLTITITTTQIIVNQSIVGLTGTIQILSLELVKQ